MANQYLGLSLFIMMLSFFIILNGLSTFDDSKAKPIIESVLVAFSSSQEDEFLEPNIKEDEARSFKDGDVLDRMEGLFRSQITSVEARKNRFGTEMHMRVHVDDFEEALSVASIENIDFEGTGSAGGAFLPTLVSLIESQETSFSYQMDMVLNIQNKDNQNANQIIQKARKVSEYAMRLEDVGLPPSLVTAGIGGGKDNYLDLYFHPYIPFNPKPDTEAQN